MHELSIALNIVHLASQEAAAAGGLHVAAIRVRLGRLAGVVAEALTSAFELARQGSAVADAALTIEEVPLRIYCDGCGREQAAVSDYEPRCVVCGTPSTQVVAGRELEIAALEVLE